MPEDPSSAGQGAPPPLNVVVEGCAHGELDQIYASIKRLEERSGKKVDLLLCCGDFQAVRNKGDLQAMNVPSKYLTMASFHKYYSGESVAPVLTLFIGGNHEASNHLHELYFGGWVAPNIYYMGCSGVVNVGGVRIAGLSGIYNGRNYRRGHFEAPPYSENSKISVYHVREYEVFKLAQLREPVDIFLSHDWPRGIYHHGDMGSLVRMKPYFKQECETNTLGSQAAELLLNQLQPSFWFSGHLHVKFAAVVRHPPSGGPSQEPRMTKFLALDKCLPNRNFLQLVEVPRPAGQRGPPVFEHDVEWLSIVRKTHDLLSPSDQTVHLPQQTPQVTEDDKQWVRQRLSDRAKTVEGLATPLAIANNFTATAPVYDPHEKPARISLIGSPQTDDLLQLLELPHKITVPYRDTTRDGMKPDGLSDDDLFFIDRGGSKMELVPQASSSDPNAIDIDEDEGGENGSGIGTTSSDPNAIDIDDEGEDDSGSGQMATDDGGGDQIVLPRIVERKKLCLPPPTQS